MAIQNGENWIHISHIYQIFADLASCMSEQHMFVVLTIFSVKVHMLYVYPLNTRFEIAPIPVHIFVGF